MVHTTLKSEISCNREQSQACLSYAESSRYCEKYHFSKRSSRQVELSSNLYQVVINGEDGEYVEYEIEADSHSEASAKAEALAADSFIDISYIEVYLIH